MLLNKQCRESCMLSNKSQSTIPYAFTVPKMQRFKICTKTQMLCIHVSTDTSSMHIIQKHHVPYLSLWQVPHPGQQGSSQQRIVSSTGAAVL